MISTASSGQTSRYDCDMLQLMLNDSVAKKYFWPMKHNDVLLIINDYNKFFNGCLKQDANGRNIAYTYDSVLSQSQIHRSKKLRSALYLCKLEPVKRGWEMDVFDPQTGSYLRLFFEKRRGVYIIRKHQLSFF